MLDLSGVLVVAEMACCKRDVEERRYLRAIFRDDPDGIERYQERVAGIDARFYDLVLAARPKLA